MAVEENGSKPNNQPGLYRHPGTGAEVNLTVNAGVGTPMIDAFIQAGFVKAEPKPVEPVAEKVEEPVEVSEPKVVEEPAIETPKKK